MTYPNLLVKDKQAILDMLSSGKPLKDILCSIVHTIEDHCALDMQGAIMLNDTSSNQLTDMISPSLPTSFTHTLKTIDISLYGGTSGVAAYLRKPIIVADIENNPLWEKKRQLAIVHSFRSSLSIPLISSNQELLGVLELYSKNIGGPNQEMTKIITIFCELASFAIEELKKNKTAVQPSQLTARCSGKRKKRKFFLELCVALSR